MAIEKFDIKEFMLNNSISQYRTVPEYVKMCEAFAVGLGTIQDGIDYLSDMIDIDKAEGIWLDYIGWLVGIKREYQDAALFFSVNDRDVNEKRYFWFAQQKVSRMGTLSDILFRQRIKAKIAYNRSKCTRNENINVIKNLTFADYVKIEQEKQFIDKMAMSQTLHYDSDKYAIIGNPTITAEGIASGFSNENYINSKVTVGQLKNKSWSVRGNWTNKGNTDTPETNILFYFGGSTAFGSVLYKTQSKTIEFLIRTGDITEAYSQDTVASKTLTATPNYINARLDFDYETGAYTAIADWGEGDTVLGTLLPETENKQLYVINTTPDNTILIGAGNGDSYNKNATDLKEFSVTVEKHKIFYGTTQEPIDFVFEKTGSVDVTEEGIASNFANLSYVTTPISLSTDDFSFSCRFLPKENTVDDKYQCIVGILDLTGDEQYGIVLNRYGRGIIFVIGDTPYGSIGGLDFDTDVWHKLDFVYKDGTATCYVDDKLQWSETVALPSVLNNDRTAIIGSYPASSQVNYGEIDLSSIKVSVDGEERLKGKRKIPMSLDITLFGNNILDSNTLLDNVNNVLGNGVGVNHLRMTGYMEVKNDEAGYNSVLAFMNNSFDKNNFTVMGSPTITDEGVASGFSGSNYLITKNTLNITQDNSFKIDFEFTTPDELGSGTFDIFGIQGYTRGQITDSGKVNFYIVTNKEIAVNFDSIGKNYKYTLSYDKKTHVMTLTVDCDGVVESADLAIGTETFAWTQAVYVGKSKRAETVPFGGSIDLKRFNITVDGKEVASGKARGTDSLILEDDTIETIPYILSLTGQKITDINYRANCEHILKSEGNVVYYTIDIRDKNYTLPI